MCLSKTNKIAENSISMRLYGEHEHLKCNEQTEACEDEKKHGQEAGRRIRGLWSYETKGSKTF